MKKVIFSLLAFTMISLLALGQNERKAVTLDEKGPNGGIVQVINESYNVEMKRNSGNIEIYVKDSQNQELNAENELTGAVVVSYNDKTQQTFVLEPGLDLSNLTLNSQGEIHFVMLWAKHNGEYFEARYYIKEGKMWEDYDKRMEELKKHEKSTSE